MNRYTMINLLKENDYRFYSNNKFYEKIDENSLRLAVDSFGWVEYMDEIINIYDLEEAGLLEEELIDQVMTHITLIDATLPNQFIFDEYVKFYKDTYNEDFLISKETGKICW